MIGCGQGSIQKTAAAFGRLRDPNIPVADKVDDVRYISKVILRLDEAIEVQADPNKMIGTGVKLRIDLSIEASQLIHMMVKFDRANHTVIAVPDLAPVRELCATTIDFVNFVVRTAWVSLSVQRNSQAREIMDVLEKCLLKMPLSKREPSEFRVMAKAYSAERDGMGLGRTSSPDAFRRLEWYLSSPTKSIKQRTKLDKMAGRQLYFKLMVAKGTADEQLTLFHDTLDSAPAMDGVARFVDDVECVMYDATSRPDVERVHQLVTDLADCVGIKFDGQHSQSCTPTLHVGEFMFSAAGIQRYAAAA